MNANLTNPTTKGKSPLAFFLLGITLGVPYFMLANAQILPNIVMANIGAFLPAMAALILVYREKGTEGMVELIKRSFDFKRIKSRVWYLPVFFLWPFIVFVQYILAPFSGLVASQPDFSLWFPLSFVVSFILALGEELGWMGYAFDPMQERFGALKASILLGLFWASIHIPYFASSGASPEWIISQFIYVATTRILFVWVYNNTGRSLFAVAAMHTLFNQVWMAFRPSGGLVGMSVPSFYNPSNLAITTIVLATLVTFLWGSKTLSQYRFARSRQLLVNK
jgi:hypothetical protein